MNANRFDQLAKSLAIAASRRSVVLGLGGALLAAVFGTGRSSEVSSAQTDDQLPLEFDEGVPDFGPIFISLDPIPLGDDLYALDGKRFTIDPDVAALVADSPTVPLLIDSETYFINPGIATSASPVLAGGTPIPFPALEGPCLGGGNSEHVALFLGHPGVTSDFVTTNAGPVGSLQWNFNLIELYADPGTLNGRRYCSGTLISEDLFLTAGHCFDQCPKRICERSPEQCPRPCPASASMLEVPKIDNTTNPISRVEVATNMHVDFNYQLDPETGLAETQVERYPVIDLVEDQLGGLDYAIVRLPNAPGLRFGRTRISRADVEPGSTLCIIGHPDGEPKKVETGQSWGFDQQKIYYEDLSTSFGNSGSGILASPHGPIVGVHTNGGCDELRIGNNHGVRISELLRVSPTLRQLVAT